MLESTLKNRYKVVSSNTLTQNFAEALSSRKIRRKIFGGSVMVTFLTIVRRLCIALCGPFGITAASLVSLYVAMVLTAGGSESFGEYGWLPQAAMVVVALRLIIGLVQPKLHTVPGIGSPMQFKGLVIREVQLSVALAAVFFFTGWPATELFMGLFVAMNLLLQITLMPFSRLLVSSVTPFATNGSSPCARRVIIVGTGSQARQTLDIIIDSPEMDTSAIGFLDYRRKGFWRYRDVPLVGHPEKLTEIIANGHVDAVFLAVEQEDVVASQTLFHKAEEMVLL